MRYMESSGKTARATPRAANAVDGCHSQQQKESLYQRGLDRICHGIAHKISLGLGQKIKADMSQERRRRYNEAEQDPPCGIRQAHCH